MRSKPGSKGRGGGRGGLGVLGSTFTPDNPFLVNLHILILKYPAMNTKTYLLCEECVSGMISHMGRLCHIAILKGSGAIVEEV